MAYAIFRRGAGYRKPLSPLTLLQSAHARRHQWATPRPEPPMPPLSLSDDEFAAVQAAAAPIHPLQRDAFLKALAVELERHPVVGPRLVHRLAADLQRRFGVEAHAETSHSEPRDRRGESSRAQRRA
jgi:hypothetical protein